MILVISNIGIQYIRFVFMRNKAAIICPTLCIIDPTILTPIIDNFVFLNIIIDIILKMEPNRLKQNATLNNPVLNIPTNSTLRIEIYIASFEPYVYKTINVIMFAKPILIPGKLKIGIKLSKIFKIIDIDNNIESLISFFMISPYFSVQFIIAFDFYYYFIRQANY